MVWIPKFCRCCPISYGLVSTAFDHSHLFTSSESSSSSLTRPIWNIQIELFYEFSKAFGRAYYEELSFIFFPNRNFIVSVNGTCSTVGPVTAAASLKDQSLAPPFCTTCKRRLASNSISLSADDAMYHCSFISHLYTNNVIRSILLECLRK